METEYERGRRQGRADVLLIIGEIRETVDEAVTYFPADGPTDTFRELSCMKKALAWIHTTAQGVWRGK